ncbi:hypothetical protein Cni_G06023 [Canna indica]|uniref:Uncharacterized protein n=1 Tax=Canna indica TaxID=4628 RepID=A0AAQ3Q5J8_9LILI|nr:hypothetical protein Cni_G06023 [Canna indica]
MSPPSGPTTPFATSSSAMRSSPRASRSSSSPPCATSQPPSPRPACRARSRSPPSSTLASSASPSHPPKAPSPPPRSLPTLGVVVQDARPVRLPTELVRRHHQRGVRGAGEGRRNERGHCGVRERVAIAGRNGGEHQERTNITPRRDGGRNAEKG